MTRCQALQEMLSQADHLPPLPSLQLQLILKRKWDQHVETLMKVGLQAYCQHTTTMSEIS